MKYRIPNFQSEQPDTAAEVFVKRCEEICRKAVTCTAASYSAPDRRLDALFTSKKTGLPILFLLLFALFWLTIRGANVPSALLSDVLFEALDFLAESARDLHIPEFLCEPLLSGIFRVLAWVVSAMLPPMAIFFPLFTLLEDFGYLPRIAFCLDRCFQNAMPAESRRSPCAWDLAATRWESPAAGLSTRPGSV